MDLVQLRHRRTPRRPPGPGAALPRAVPRAWARTSPPTTWPTARCTAGRPSSTSWRRPGPSALAERALAAGHVTTGTTPRWRPPTSTPRPGQAGRAHGHGARAPGRAGFEANAAADRIDATPAADWDRTGHGGGHRPQGHGPGPARSAVDAGVTHLRAAETVLHAVAAPPRRPQLQVFSPCPTGPHIRGGDRPESPPASPRRLQEENPMHPVTRRSFLATGSAGALAVAGAATIGGPLASVAAADTADELTGARPPRSGPTMLQVARRRHRRGRDPRGRALHRVHRQEPRGPCCEPPGKDHPDVLPSRSARHLQGPGRRQHRHLRVASPRTTPSRSSPATSRAGSGRRPELLRVRRRRALRDQHRQRRRRQAEHHLPVQLRDGEHEPEHVPLQHGSDHPLDDPTWNRRQTYKLRKVTRPAGPARPDRRHRAGHPHAALQHRSPLDPELRGPGGRRRQDVPHGREGLRRPAGRELLRRPRVRVRPRDAAALPGPAPDPDPARGRCRLHRAGERPLAGHPGADGAPDPGRPRPATRCPPTR